MTDKTDMTIDYDAIVTGQLRAVIPAVLSKLLAQNPGATEIPSPHHFYITFSTTAKGVVVPSYLKNQYPEEMTIVLQYQFWNLTVRESDFSVVLSFGKTPAAITIPYDAIIQFSDPAVNFMLRFDDREDKSPRDNKDDDNVQLLTSVAPEQSNDKFVDDKRQNRLEPEKENDKEKSNVVSLAAFREQQEK
ncbi:MAG: ClpXP protease specificity-enhancing factor SspB [Hydrotalea sp.]|nr:ClpXP protease specificity-enhancing factor SspB [Hydrotalea sp.]